MLPAIIRTCQNSPARNISRTEKEGKIDFEGGGRTISPNAANGQGRR